MSTAQQTSQKAAVRRFIDAANTGDEALKSRRWAGLPRRFCAGDVGAQLDMLGRPSAFSLAVWTEA
jgi:hypothetical protein